MRYLVAFLTFIIFVFIFTNKEFIYFKLENELAKNSITLNEKIESKINGVKLSNIEVYFKNLKIADIKKADLSIDIYKNSLILENLKLNSEEIKNLEIKYSIFNPFMIDIVSSKLNGYIDLKNRKLFVKSSLKSFRQISRSGKYETNF
jgi:hypothetical protein